eukprot:TRINITY_DN6269_c0_g1_i2.p1 TRINITY_DN6269_c0_g1~~TRINITY_DN6269_c0_g1_i2.p1  ORF type:complete len:235 (+),score=40.86 TRINITY_DN6269_c0_g1_i2:94-705(+)
MDAVGPMEVFRAAITLGAPLVCRLCTKSPVKVVKGSYGLLFQPDTVFVPGEADIVVVPGGGWANRNPVMGSWAEFQDGTLIELLREAARVAEVKAQENQVVVFAGVCTGTMLLAHAGIVGNRRSTTHHRAFRDLEETGAILVQERVVDVGGIPTLVTAGGVTSGLDLALYIVRKYFSEEVAEKVAQRLEYTPFFPSAELEDNK